MNLKDTKLYQAIERSSTETIKKVSYDYVMEGRDINIRDKTTGKSLMHHIVDYAHRFVEPHLLSVIYFLSCKGAQLDDQDNNGETCLHTVVRKQGACRIMVAFLR